ncbi:hypothetical protein [Synechococcus sp. PCC 6312]|uniref:slr1601 family putative cell division protein n=1 Tax=Synechococcus sp. (strain ATCC 27167 / PCC 6312) TaxID=195253 RepID=UPI00029F1387|nr:hypothetical protein [Synechococcus sp. PCC 6312]AFY61500.1 hypothetical protein Syn6312_2395 [Synechococcus sp. PCC 6312]
MTATAPKPSPPVRPKRNLSLAAKHRQIGREIIVKVLINLGIVTAGLVALTQLLPYYLAQREKLTNLEAAQKEAQARVNELKVHYQQDNQPQAIERIAQEDANLIRPNQRRIVWVKPGVAAHSDPAPLNSPVPQPSDSTSPPPIP